MDEKNTIKVCYVTHQPNITGANKSLVDILSELDRKKVEPLVIVSKEGPLIDELKKIHVPFYYFRYYNSTSVRKGKWKNCIRRIINFLSSYKIAFFLMNKSVDIIHINSLMNSTGMEAALKAKKPYIIHIRDFIEEDHDLRFMNPQKQYRLLEKSDVAIAISKAIYEKYKNLVPDAKIITMHNCISIDRYYEVHSRIFSNDVVSMLIAGTIKEGKGQLDAIRAARILNDEYEIKVELHIVGDGNGTSYESEIKRYVKDNNLQYIIFHPFMELRSIRRECDIGLMCSKNEAMGRVTIENMYAGLLVIGANSGATPELIEDGQTGFLYKTGDYRELAEVIYKAFNEIDISNRIAKKAQRLSVNKFSPQRYIERLDGIYSSLIRYNNTR